jgi:hypothetical protein
LYRVRDAFIRGKSPLSTICRLYTIDKMTWCSAGETLKNN